LRVRKEQFVTCGEDGVAADKEWMLENMKLCEEM